MWYRKQKLFKHKQNAHIYLIHYNRNLKEKKGHGYLMVMFKVSQFQRENQYILSKDLLVYCTCKEGCKQGQTKKYNFKSSYSCDFAEQGLLVTIFLHSGIQ